MELIRNLLVRASNGQVRLPYEQNWIIHDGTTAKDAPARVPSFGQLSDSGDKGPEQPMFTVSHRHLPAWARWAPKRNPNDEGMDQSAYFESGDEAPLGEEEVVISNLPLMAAEVSQLLNSIEEIMPIQRHRRLRKLRVPSMFRRRWYLTAVGAPIVSYVSYNLIKKGMGSKVLRLAISKIVQFFHERVYQPTLAM